MRKSLFWLALFCFSLSTGLTSAQTGNYLFFTFLNPDPAKSVTAVSLGSNILQQHDQYINGLMDNKTVKASGKTEKGGYILITRSNDIDGAKKIVEADPLVTSGGFIVETFPLMVANNWVCGPKKPYKTVQYQLVRLLFNDDFFG
ncbi:MAG: hypothetical protein GXO86_00610, partial [Chlorobi bacterium]|nr:hypothetical protein [Chlorobiota bacterium]